VRHPPGLEHEVSGTGEQDLLANLDAHLASQHVGVLILVAVGVGGRSKGPRPDRVLDERYLSTFLWAFFLIAFVLMLLRYLRTASKSALMRS
jgi:hypothetical protein